VIITAGTSANYYEVTVSSHKIPKDQHPLNTVESISLIIMLPFFIRALSAT